MRAFSTLLYLTLVSSALAAPSFSPRLMSKDPMALHRRSIVPSVSNLLSTPASFANSVIDLLANSAAHVLKRPNPSGQSPLSVSGMEGHEEDHAYATEYYASYEDEVSDWEERHAQCAEVCRVRMIEGANNGHQALCSSEGLESTLECAQCIDITWPEDKYENSAMAEFDRIAKTCQVGSSSAQV